MILKKPYAFLIKHFKLIHLIICALLVYIAYKCNDMLYYFTQYINAGYYIKIGDVVGDYINIYLYLSLFIILFLILTTIVLLHIKEKNTFIYAAIFMVYIIVAGLVINGHMNLLNMQLEVIDFRKVRLYKDLLFVSMFVQYASIVFVLIRGLGFNIKKFNFEKDLEELDISESDNAEFEFTVELNTNSFARKLRRKKRHLKYFFAEHKHLFFIIGIFIVLSACIVTFISIGTKTFAYKQNKTVKINDNTIVVNNSYIVEKDYLGKIISSDSKYLIVNFGVKNIGDAPSGLDLDKFSLIIDDKTYYPIKSNEESFFDFGEYYKGLKLKKNTARTYILVFKVLNNKIDSNRYIFRYSALQTKNDETINKDFDIKLDPISKWIEQEIDSKKLKETLNLNASILGNTKLIINSYEIKPSFNIKYNYCIGSVCDELTTTLLPNNLNKDIRTILKLNLNIDYDNIITSSIIKDKSYLISNLSKIEFVVDGKTIENTSIIDITPDEIKSGNDIYLDVDAKIAKASKITIIIDIRGSKYSYDILE